MDVVHDRLSLSFSLNTHFFPPYEDSFLFFRIFAIILQNLEVYMELKTADRPDWKRVLERTFEVTYKDNAGFRGKVTAIHLKKVSVPLVVTYSEREICLVNDSYTWFQHFPEGKNYTITTVINDHGEVVQWYIDICKEHGVNNDGIPWYLDLYLDVVILPNGETLVLDDHELMEAYQTGNITADEVKLAKDTALDIHIRYKEGTFIDIEVCKKHALEWYCKMKFN
jgi:predicted RNA-binding protein associated with RNAse of E/G family